MATRMRLRNNGDNKPGLGRPLIPAEPVYPSFPAFCLGFYFLFLHLHSASRCGLNDMQTKEGTGGAGGAHRYGGAGNHTNATENSN